MMSLYVLPAYGYFKLQWLANLARIQFEFNVEIIVPVMKAPIYQSYVWMTTKLAAALAFDCITSQNQC
jgi:hypothetical protein